jgi:hypothetical protein
MNILNINKQVLIIVASCLISFLGSATTYTVSVGEVDDGSIGTLRYAINQLNSSGTAGSPAANNTININLTDGSTGITLESNLPVLQNGVTINGPSGGLTISGSNQYRLFATSNASLTLSNLTLQDGLALGGNGSGGGGGGMGAGGGIYIDYGQVLNVSNTAIIGCFAQGGNGSNGNNGGGGGASWAIAANNGLAGSNGSTASGGGDYPGVGSTGGGVAYSGTHLGYGGGNGGSDGYTGTAGIGGGDNNGANGSGSDGGDGGYCGGGGGASDTTNNSAGGGGGNGGGDGSIGVLRGGGGGGYGSGGSGAINGLNIGGGGGGGFGGGGGGGSALGVDGPAGGGGGGFGGGGGSGSTTVAATGGSFAGVGAISGVGLGGGGAGLGGAIFVGDSAILQIGNLGSSVLSNLNGTQGGAVGGTGYANDIFLFQGAQVQFIGSTDATIAFAIQSDTSAPAGHLDGGISVNVTNSATITMESINNNYQGGTTIQNGTLVIAGVVPTVGDININANGTLTLEVANAASSGAFINSGSVNIEALFTPSNFASFTNNTALYVTGNGSIGGNVTATGSLTVGQNWLRTASHCNLVTSNAISFTSINVHNTSSIETTGGGSITSNLYLLGLGNFSGNNITGSMLTIGQDSFNRLNRATIFDASQNISGFPTINVNAGSFNTNGNIISSVDTAFNIASDGTATFDTVVTGTGSLTVNGILNSSVVNSVGLSGLISIGGTLNVLENLNLNNTINCSGNIIVSSGKNLTVNDTLYLFGNSTLVGDIIGGVSSSLIIGEDSTTAMYPSTNSTIAASISNIPTINVKYGAVTASGSITGVTSSFNIDSGATGTFNGLVDTTVAATNAGTLVAGNTINVNSYTSTGTTNFVISDATIVGFINSAGAIDFGANPVSVTYNWLDAIAGNVYPWTLATGSSIAPTPVQVIPPPNTIADTWQVTQTATDLQISLTKGQLNPTTPIIGPIINAMSLDPLNQSQFILVNALGNAFTQAELDTYVSQLIPDLNSSVINIRKQDAVFRQINHRISTLRDKVSLNETSGFVAGDIDLNKAFWIGPFGSFANQSPKDNNFGYRAYSGGVILGIDVEINDHNLLGLAYARSTTTVQSKINPGVQSRTVGYHLMLYGNHIFGVNQQSYLEWIASGATNANSGNRRILITGNNFNVDSSFDGYQGGFLVNYGQSFKYSCCVDLIPYGTIQYNFIHTPPYYETTSSPAALYVDNGFNNVLMLGIGTKTAIKTNSRRMHGRTMLGAVIGYDVISSDQVTTSNFVSGSAAFTFVTAAERLSLNLDADCTFNMDYGTQLQFVYEFQIRKGYTANAVTAKFKFPF